MKVTVLGAGGMGCAMAARLVDTGHEVTVWDRAPDRACPSSGGPVAVTADLSGAVGDASVVITMVTNGEAVQAVAERLARAVAAGYGRDDVAAVAAVD